MAGDDVGLVWADLIGRADRARAETQVRDSYRSGLLRVVDEVALRVVIGLLANDLDRILVRADRAVGTQTPEDALYCFTALYGESRIVRPGWYASHRR